MWKIPENGDEMDGELARKAREFAEIMNGGLVNGETLDEIIKSLRRAKDHSTYEGLRMYVASGNYFSRN